jgi:cytochrome c551/c552
VARLPDDDPITSKSYALHYLLATVVLMSTLFWALWDEAYGQRPWKHYQEVFRDRYSKYLKTAKSRSAQSEKEVESTSDYQKLKADYESASNQAKPRVAEINDKLRDLNGKILAVQNVFTDKRAYVNALTYEMETTGSSSSKKSKQREIDEYKQGPFTVEYPDASKKKFNFAQLEEEYASLKDERAKLNSELGDLVKPVTQAKAKMDQYVADHMVSLSPAQVRGLQNKAGDIEPEIRQINVGEANLVDRCESCHMGVREPLKLTAAALAAPGHKPDEYARAFVSHPEGGLLKTHDPDRFGCSPCHNGNGRATTSVEKAHGHYEHWLWPLYAKENIEAGCQTCHARDMLLVSGDGGQVISEGKDLFRQRGCMGCHRYAGYDTEPDDLKAISQQIKQLEQQKIDNLKLSADVTRQADQASDNDTANKLYAHAESLKVDNSKIDGQLEQLDLRSRDLMRDQKKIGPNLKDVRLKLNRDWIPVWLTRPTDFRPTTKMPNFRLNEEQIHSIAAYLWQTALTDPLPHTKPGDSAHGKELFETRGCLACHSVGEGEEQQGGTFAANLTRVGEKANYDYLVRWVHNPRERTRPYCPYEKKDIGPEDYARHNLAYRFDFDHSTCPNDGHELQVENMTVMPSLRLSQEDAQDVAAYLVSLKKKDPSSYPIAAYMQDANLKEEGAKWIRHFGCAGCHEISGFEEEGRIGTELTTEGSKPLERLDFALLTDEAQRGEGEPIVDKEDRARLPEGPAKGPWYNHKGFFEHKLSEPNVFDKGLVKAETERLRMPNVHLTSEQVRALTTFLLGSQETSLPASYKYAPEDERRDIQEGWWIVKKYNCMGCHQFYPGQQTALMGMKRYQDPDWKEQLPPKLLTEGARVNPEWLRQFLANPALSTTDTNRNGVRPYLKAHMPTFFFSDHELRVLVRFFQALSKQPLPYVPDAVPALTARETDMARSLFSSPAAPCLKCHATGDPQHDRTATAPNFLLAKDRLKPGWTERWLLDPQAISPGTSMPSGLFKQDDKGHWVFSGPTPASFQGYDQDHNKLLARYIFQLTGEEQRRIAASMPRSVAPARKTSTAPPPGGAAGSSHNNSAPSGGSR